jgi:hypothetical protein
MFINIIVLYAKKEAEVVNAPNHVAGPACIYRKLSGGSAVMLTNASRTPTPID